MFRCFSSIFILVLGWPASLALAQTAQFHGPIAGFVYSHAAGTVRPLLGVPGATQIGATALSGLDFASIAPGGKWALIVQAGNTSLVEGLSALNPAASPAGGLIAAVSRVVWNLDGSFALLYSSSGNQLQRVGFTDAGAAADPPVDLSAWGPLTALAIDPAGAQIAFGVAGSGLYLFQAGQSPAPISSMAQPAAAAFDPTGRRLYAVDLAQQQISEFDSGSSAIAFASLAQSNGSAVTPVGLAVSGDGHYLMLPDSASQLVWVYDTTSGTMTNSIPLDFTPSRFEAISAAPSFLLNGENSAEWLMVLDGRQAPGISFVPASQGVAQ